MCANILGPVSTSNDQKLEYYSLYKQATVGDVNTGSKSNAARMSAEQLKYMINFVVMELRLLIDRQTLIITSK